MEQLPLEGFQKLFTFKNIQNHQLSSEKK